LHRIDPNSLPYRPCVGIMLLNAQSMIWLGRRFNDFVTDERHRRWQMPQGGIDSGEDARDAVFRELYEETGIRSAEIIGESNNWISYDLPLEAVGRALGGRYRGQTQKWFAMRFTGDESEINLAPEGGSPEFDAWKWAAANEVLDEIVAFKRETYEAVLKEFAHLLG
jgi:putative (di)nucleoside polyphosphate hydrolase